MSRSITPASCSASRGPAPAWHIFAPEYPPQPGGVSDYTELTARGLSDAGDHVHVWCPGLDAPMPADASVCVHRELGTLRRADLQRVDAMLNRYAGPRRLLVQWVPHGYGYRAMNVGFCMWLLGRAERYGDEIDLMVHEPYLSFSARSWRQSGVAVVHRVMTAVLLRAASRVWVSIPAWTTRLRPYAFGRAVPFTWLPVPSNVPVVRDPDGTAAVRARYSSDGGFVVGHFGTYGRSIVDLLSPVIPALMGPRDPVSMVLMGPGGVRLRDDVVGRFPELSTRLHATGRLDPAELSRHLSACDAMVQPYPDGISSRRTSAMAALSHARPVVTTEGKLTEPLWAASGGVVLTPVAEPLVMARATWELLNDPRRRASVTAAGAALYENRFSARHLVATLRGAA